MLRGSLRSSRHSSSTTSPPPRVRVPRHVAWLVVWLVVDYFNYAARSGVSARRAVRCAARRRLLRLHRTSGCLGTSRGSSRGSSSTTSPTPCVQVPRHVARLVTRLVAPLVIDYFTSATRPGASARRAARHTTRRRLLHLRRASRCLGISRGSLRGSSHQSSSTTSPPPHVRVPRHIARLVMRLVVDYFDYTARPGASACCTARHAARRAARRRVLSLHRASGCRGLSRSSSLGLSRDSSSTTSPRADSSSLLFLVRARRRLLRLTQARHRLLHLRRTFGFFGTSRDSSRGPSSTTSTTPGVQVPRHVARLVTWLVTPLVVDYFASTARPGALARLAARHAARRRLLQLRHASRCLGMSHCSSRGSSCRSSLTSSPTPCVRVLRHVARLVVDYFAYVVRLGASAHHVVRHAAHRRLLCAPRLRLAATLALLQPRCVSRLLVSRQH
jgi:hypothetical protein